MREHTVVCPCCGAENPVGFAVNPTTHTVIGCDDCLQFVYAVDYETEKREETNDSKRVSVES